MILNIRSQTGFRQRVRLRAFNNVPPVRIGSGEEADIRIGDPSCEAIHCAVRYWDDVFVLRRVAESKATCLNGREIVVAPLWPGDQIRIGDTTLDVVAEMSPGDVTVVLKVET